MIRVRTGDAVLACIEVLRKRSLKIAFIFKLTNKILFVRHTGDGAWVHMPPSRRSWSLRASWTSMADPTKTRPRSTCDRYQTWGHPRKLPLLPRLMQVSVVAVACESARFP